MKYLFIFAFSLLCLACTFDHTQSSPDNNAQFIETPCKRGGEPNLFVSENGQVLLSWIEYENDSTDVLLFSYLGLDRWSPPREIARGKNWFVNWADFPAVVSFRENDQNLLAHWLQKSADGTYDYDIHISISNDGGATWQPSFILHQDGVNAEHGFVSLISAGDNKVFAAWLDGRNTKNNEIADSDTHPNHGQGSMTLRGAYIDANGVITDSHELDAQVCDCCQTTSAMTNEGPVVAYRDRSRNEIRDISIVRPTSGNRWLMPKSIFNDNWKVEGCPVNGPSMDAIDNSVCVAWYTEANAQPQVKVAFSTDNGSNFDLPIIIDDQDPLGRVSSVLVSKDQAVICWLGQREGNAFIHYMSVMSNGEKGERKTLIASASTRKSGFPQMIVLGDKLIFAWSQIARESTIVKSAIVNIPKFSK